MPNSNRNDMMNDYHTNVPENGNAKVKDVWDPPPPKPVYKMDRKNQQQKRPNNVNSNNGPIKKVQSGDQNRRESGRHYDKPWQKNAVNHEKEKEKQIQKEKEKEQNAFLYQVYPEGDGPDAELIKML